MYITELLYNHIPVNNFVNNFIFLCTEKDISPVGGSRDPNFELKDNIVIKRTTNCIKAIFKTLDSD